MSHWQNNKTNYSRGITGNGDHSVPRKGNKRKRHACLPERHAIGHEHIVEAVAGGQQARQTQQHHRVLLVQPEGAQRVQRLLQRRHLVASILPRFLLAQPDKDTILKPSISVRPGLSATGASILLRVSFSTYTLQVFTRSE